MTLGADRLMEWLGKLPSTNARIAISLCCIVLTAVTYCIHWAAPDGGWEMWLAFLAALSGLDAVQFFAKRKTDASHIEAVGKSKAPTPAEPPK